MFNWSFNWLNITWAVTLGNSLLWCTNITKVHHRKHVKEDFSVWINRYMFISVIHLTAGTCWSFVSLTHLSPCCRLAQVVHDVTTVGFKWSGNSASLAQTRTVPVEFWSVPSCDALQLTTPYQTAGRFQSKAKRLHGYTCRYLRQNFEFLNLDPSVGHSC